MTFVVQERKHVGLCCTDINNLAMTIEVERNDVGVIVLRGKNLYCAVCRKVTCRHSQQFQFLGNSEDDDYPPELQQMLQLAAGKSSDSTSALTSVRTRSTRCIDFFPSEILSVSLMCLQKFSIDANATLFPEERCECDSQLVSKKEKIPLITSTSVAFVEGTVYLLSLNDQC